MDAVRHPIRKIKSEKNADSEQISPQNFILGERICRLCLGAKANTDIFEKESEMVAKILLNLLVCCDLEISENDGLPKHICPSCLDTLEIASNFRTTCQENDKILRTQYLSIPIVKDEFFSDNDIPDALSDDELIKDEIDIKDTEYFIDVKTTKRKHKTTLKRKTKEIKIKKEIIEKPVKIRKSVHDNSHLCTICGKYFEKRSTYHSHIRSHTNEVFHCNECQKTFNRKSKLQEHMITHFGVKNIPCDECGKLFASRAYVQRHVDKVHKRLRVVQCTICLKQLADNHTLKYHMKTHTGEKDYVCPLCQKQFTFKLSLQYHLRTHSGERPYSCRYCHKRFSDSKSSADHEMLHTGETPYKCPICAKGFAQLSNMKSHFRYNHKGEDITDYPSYKKRNNKNNEVFVPKEIVPIVK